MKNKSYNFQLSYIDLLLNLFSTVLVLFLLTALMVQPIKKNENEGIKKDAEYIIQIKWSLDIDCDVDVWIRNPLGDIVGFKNPNAGLMHLERDDLGKYGDTAQDLLGKTIVNSNNEEILTIRGIIPGKYTVNLHLYTCRTDPTITGKPMIPLEVGTPVPVPVSVILIKLNPKYEVLDQRIIQLNKVWQEITVYSFEMNQTTISGNYDTTPMKLVTKVPQ